jgi:hypothetical protein
MMDLIKKYATAFWFVGIVAALYGGYVLFFAQGTAPVVEVSETAATPDQDLIALLFELKGIRLDSGLFDDPLFKALKDFGRDLVSEPVGRNNPFAPLTGTQIEVPKPVVKNKVSP